MQAFDDRGGWLDDELRSLRQLDASADRVLRTRQACRDVIEQRRAGRARHRRLAWAEPLAVTAASLVYLAAAVRASLALLGI